MDAVRAFNNELSSLYESKPPVSRAKMAQVTKCAIKAIKFYKHVVQSVEKFIQKCKPEYKVPGLYVIDSIVRQSRHQFGPEKDVFSPRFTKNIVGTFTHLFKCPEEERSRVVRVLNLWQKNAVFPMEVIQPLLDLASNPESVDLVSSAQKSVDAVVSTSQKITLPGVTPPPPAAAATNNGEVNSSSSQIQQQTQMLSTITKLLQQAKEGSMIKTAPESQLQQLQHLQQQLLMQTESLAKPQQTTTAPPIDSSLLAQIQTLTTQLLTKTGPSTNTEPAPETSKQASVEPMFNKELPGLNKEPSFNMEQLFSKEPVFNREPVIIKEPLFNKKLLDFDYGDTDEEDDKPEQQPKQHFQQEQQQNQHFQQEQQQNQHFQQEKQQHQHFQQEQQIAPVTLPQGPPPQPPPPPGPLLPDPNFLQRLQQMSQQPPPPGHLHQMPQQQPPPGHMQQMFHQPPPPGHMQQVPQQPPLPGHMQQMPQQQPPPGHMQQMPQQPPLPGHMQQMPQQPPLPGHMQQMPQLPPPPGHVQQMFQQPPPPGHLQHMPQQHHQPPPPGHVQQMPQQQHLQQNLGSQDQFRAQLLEQQQEQFDREIQQASSMSHLPLQELNQSPGQDRRAAEDQEDRDGHEKHERSERRKRRGSRDRSRDRSRSPRRRSRRSRSRSRDRRRRSRSRDHHRRSRSRDRERRERDRERDRERKKMGLPPLKNNYISICSTTLWFGRLTKHTTEEELREHIEKYGVIRTINMIPPRGCAFVCLSRRRDANKALDRLKGVKINGSSIKVAWAPGVGVKESVYKDLWDVDQGVTYIPWSELPTDVVPFVAGGMVDLDSLPERLKGMSTGEEEPEPPPQPQPPNTNVENISLPTPPPPAAGAGGAGMPMPGQAHNFPPPPPGQGPMNFMGPGGPLGLLGPPPHMGIRPGMGPPLPLGVRPGMGGPVNLANGGGPVQGNVGPQGPFMGGQANHLGPGPRPPFGPGGNVPRFPFMQGPGAMQPPFPNSDGSGKQPGMGDRDMRAPAAEPKEWPPDDNVNADEDSDDDHRMDSDERVNSAGGQKHVPAPGPPPNMPPIRGPFGLRGPAPPGQRPPEAMIGISRVPGPPNMGMPPILSLHMIPPNQPQTLLVSGGPVPGYALPPGGVRLPMGVRPGLVTTTTAPHLLAGPPGAPLAVPVNLNGPMIVSRPPGLPPPPNVGNEMGLQNSDIPLPPHDGPRPLGPGPHLPPGPPILGRGFAPMTIRPRGGPGLLGSGPGPHPVPGFNRFGGPRQFMGPAFRGMERPPFGNRFGLPLRPALEFMDQDEREDRDERRPFHRIDDDGGDHVEMQEQTNDIDERRSGTPRKDGKQDVDMRQDIDERSKSARVSGRPSRWNRSTEQEEATKAVVADPPISQSEGTTPVASDTISESSVTKEEADVPPESSSVAASAGAAAGDVVLKDEVVDTAEKGSAQENPVENSTDNIASS